jgi:hypothetical protein
MSSYCLREDLHPTREMRAGGSVEGVLLVDPLDPNTTLWRRWNFLSMNKRTMIGDDYSNTDQVQKRGICRRRHRLRSLCHGIERIHMLMTDSRLVRVASHKWKRLRRRRVRAMKEMFF